jgi:Sec-independent protein secretion pathway component TatC
MSDDFWTGVVAGVVGFAVVAAIAAWFRRKLSEFLNPTKKQKVGHSTDKTPSQIIKTSLLAGIEILVGLALLGGIAYALITWR